MPSITTAAPKLAVDRVTKRYGDVTAMLDISLDVAPGECLGIVGESGSGKTTLLRSFNRMVEPDSGEIRLDGAAIRGIDPIQLRRSIGYVQQRGGLLPHWSVLRNAAMVPWLNGDTDATDRATAALQLAGLSPDEVGARYPSELSGGQQQRVAIARALAAEPEVLLLDEAFSALDAITRADLHRTFLDLRQKLGITTVLVTHDLAEAARLADRVGVMLGGQLIQIDTWERLNSAPGHPYVHELLDKARMDQP